MDSILPVAITLVTIAIVAVSLFSARKMITGMLSPLLAQQAETKRLLTVGIPCPARVLHIEQTGTSVAVMGVQSYELHFQLEVTPPAAAAYRGGSGPYHTTMVALVPMLDVPRVQPGNVITVRVDPHDPRKMAFESATAPGQSPAYAPPPAAYSAPAYPASAPAAYPASAPAAYSAAAPAPYPGAAPGGYVAAPMANGAGAPAGAYSPAAWPAAQHASPRGAPAPGNYSAPPGGNQR